MNPWDSFLTSVATAGTAAVSDIIGATGAAQVANIQAASSAPAPAITFSSKGGGIGISNNMMLVLGLGIAAFFVMRS